MKRIFALISVAALLASCSKQSTINPIEGNNDEPAPVMLEKVQVAGSVNTGTKVDIANMKWESGDRIRIWVKSAIGAQGYDGDELEINPSDGSFSGEIVKPQPSDVLYVAYNASGFDKSVEANYGPIFNIEANQNSASGGATKAMLQTEYIYTGGSLKNLSFTLVAATAKLKIVITNGAKVKAVEFAGMNNEILTGTNGKTISYSGAASSEVEFVIPAKTFSKGYKITYTGSDDKKMYQSYGGGNSVVFEAGKARTVNCAFTPFSISCGIDVANAPKTSYDYYLAGNITKANSADFETVGRLSGGADEKPWQYDEDAQGIFTGKIERGKAKVVISGISSSLIPSNLKIKEYGCYVKRVGGQEGKDVYATGLSVDLTKDFSWDVLYNKEEAATHMIEVDAGDLEIKPYLVVNDGTQDAEYKAPTAYTLHVTGLPHRSDHKDLWYVNPSSVSGKVQRLNDDKGNPIDMFYDPNKSTWTDFAVRSRSFIIPSTSDINAKIVMNGVTWAPHTLNAYFWFDATQNDYVLHKDVAKGDSKVRSSEKLNNLADCDAYVENDESGDNYSYHDLGSGGRYGMINTGKDIVTLSQDKSSVSIYLWIYRGSTTAIFDYPGYWCNHIRVEYAQ